jgi:hypothetical protein
MSDFSQGEGWWQASDGKWYPPDQATGQVPPIAPTQPFGAPIDPPTAPMGLPLGPPAGALPGPVAGPAPAKSGIGTGPIVGIVIAVVVIIGAIAFFATRGDNKKNVVATKSASSSSSSSSSKSSSSKSSSSSNSSSSGAPKVVAPSGFKVFSNDKDAFALAIPQTMEAIDLTGGDLDRLIQSLADSNPEIGKLGPQIKSVFASGGKLFAIDSGSAAATGFADNVNIIATTGPSDVTNAAVRSQVQSQLESVGGLNVTFQTVTANGRKILTTSYELPITNADGTATTIFGVGDHAVDRRLRQQRRVRRDRPDVRRERVGAATGQPSSRSWATAPHISVDNRSDSTSTRSSSPWNITP